MDSHAIFSSFGLVAASEMGDKTQLLAFSLAARFKKPWAVLAGIFVATVLNHALASTAGQWVAGLLEPRTLKFILAFTFLAFAAWTLKPDQLDDAQTRKHRYGAFLTTTVLFFLAEMGDKTQLATVALAAKYQSWVAVTLGTTLGMMVSDGLAVFLGEKLSTRAQAKWVRIVSATLFFAFGVSMFVAALF